MQKTILISGALLLATTVAGVLFWQSSENFRSDRAVSDVASGAQGAAEGVAGHMPMTSGMGGMMGGEMSLTSERAFIEHMVPHHEEAIATAKEVLERGGTTPGMVDLAENIIASQTAEVTLMKENYEAWFGEGYQSTEEYEPMMRDLKPHSGAALDRVFLHDMTMHHMGAIMMSRSVQPYIEHEVMRELTNDIIVNQSSEIRVMQQLFAELPDNGM